MLSSTVNHAKRNATLDLLRAIATLVIILHHAYAPVKIRVEKYYDHLYNGLVECFVILKRGGWVAVDMFFVLSGFLVSGLLFNEYIKYREINVKNFLIRRGFKIYPSFIFFIWGSYLLKIVLINYAREPLPAISALLNDMFFLHNYLGGRWEHTWSLDVEEFFYLVVPFVFYLLVKKNNLTLKSFVTGYIMLLVFGIICRGLTVHYANGYDFDKQQTQTHYRLDGLFLGVLISYIYNFKPHLLKAIYKNSVLFGIIGALLIVPNFCFDRETNLWVTVVLLATNPIGFGLLIIISLNSLKNVNKRSLLTVGKCSYTIYLWHLCVNSFCQSLYFKFIAATNNHPSVHQLQQLIYVFYLVLYIGASLSLGILLTRLIEIPVLKVRDKYFPAKSRNIIIHVPIPQLEESEKQVQTS